MRLLAEDREKWQQDLGSGDCQILKGKKQEESMLGDVLDAIIYRKELKLAKTENQPSIVNDLLPYAVPKAKLPNNTIVRRYISAKKVTKP